MNGGSEVREVAELQRVLRCSQRRARFWCVAAWVVLAGCVVLAAFVYQLDQISEDQAEQIEAQRTNVDTFIAQRDQAKRAEIEAKQKLGECEQRRSEGEAKLNLVAREPFHDAGVLEAVVAELRRPNPCACVLRSCSDGTFRIIDSR